MDPTSHISSVTLFHYLINAVQLTEDEKHHLEMCVHCQSMLDEWEKYINPAMIRAA